MVEILENTFSLFTFMFYVMPCQKKNPNFSRFYIKVKTKVIFQSISFIQPESSLYHCPWIKTVLSLWMFSTGLLKDTSKEAGMEAVAGQRVYCPHWELQSINYSGSSSFIFSFTLLVLYFYMHWFDVFCWIRKLSNLFSMDDKYVKSG